MKELDFDELDKAVNSLMTSGPQNSQQNTVGLDGPSDTVVTIPDSSVQQPQSAPPPVATTTTASSDAAAPTPAPTPVPERQPAPATISESSAPQVAGLAQKRNGRFMDVVHPSSDMRSAPKLQSRQGVNITPLSREITAEPIVSPERQPDQASEPTTSKAESSVVPAATQPTTSDSWPDPLDSMQSSEPLPSPEVAVVPDDVPAKDPEAATPVAKPIPSADATNSPFLPDAKVEKRPLGNSATVDIIPEAKSAPSTDSKPAVQEDVAQVAEPSIPPELGEDLLAIESDTAHQHKPVTQQTSSMSPPTAQLSIPQQYKSQPSTGDQQHAAIYDNVSQPQTQPLAHPAKKKSGWLVVVAILVLIILGAGGAAAYYFLSM